MSVNADSADVEGNILCSWQGAKMASEHMTYSFILVFDIISVEGRFPQNLCQDRGKGMLKSTLIKIVVAGESIACVKLTNQKSEH